MRKAFIFLLLILFIAGCGAGKRERRADEVKTGILKIGLTKQGFLDTWGDPDRVKTVAGEEFVSANWSGMGGSFYRGRHTFEVWTYEKVNTDLVFDRERLVGWRTDRTVKELKAISGEGTSERETAEPTEERSSSGRRRAHEQ